MSDLDLMIYVDMFLALIVVAFLTKSLIDEDIRKAKKIADILKKYESAAEKLDYQRAVEDTEYCERHEPTYNSDDGSM